MIELPVTSYPEQKFSTSIQGNLYRLRVSFNTYTRNWTLDIESGGRPLISGINLVGGVNLLGQYNLPISNLYAVNIEDADVDAEVDTLGDTVKLVIFEEGELDVSDI